MKKKISLAELESYPLQELRGRLDLCQEAISVVRFFADKNLGRNSTITEKVYELGNSLRSFRICFEGLISIAYKSLGRRADIIRKAPERAYDQRLVNLRELKNEPYDFIYAMVSIGIGKLFLEISREINSLGLGSKNDDEYKAKFGKVFNNIKEIQLLTGGCS